MCAMENSLLNDVCLVLEEGKEKWILYTKLAANKSVRLGVSDGVNTWATDVWQDTEYLSCNILSGRAVKVEMRKEDGQVWVEVGDRMKLKLQATPPGKEEPVRELLFQLARTCQGLRQRVDQQSSSSFAYIAQPPLPKVGHLKGKRGVTAGMSVVNPNSKKIKTKAQGVTFSD